MIALDTNALLRWIVADDRVQHRRVIAALTRETQRKQRIFLPEIVIVEAMWTLKRSYKLKREDAVHALRELLSASMLAIENETLVTQALVAYSNGRGDFSDYLIREHTRAADAIPVLTFDDALLDDADFEYP